jgi:hypothetical protein
MLALHLLDLAADPVAVLQPHLVGERRRAKEAEEQNDADGHAALCWPFIAALMKVRETIEGG